MLIYPGSDFSFFLSSFSWRKFLCLLDIFIVRYFHLMID